MACIFLSAKVEYKKKSQTFSTKNSWEPRSSLLLDLYTYRQHLYEQKENITQIKHEWKKKDPILAPLRTYL